MYGGSPDPRRPYPAFHYASMKVVRPIIGLVLFATAAFGTNDSPADVLRPIIYAHDEDAAAAMRSAPRIVVIEISSVDFTGDMRLVDKPADMGGPMVPAITLYLARIRGKVLLTIRGSEAADVEFYSWLWASGKHGGPRLFNPLPGSIHAMFLRTQGAYLHTVGDYPSYDLEFHSSYASGIPAEWASAASTGDPVARLIVARLHAEFNHHQGDARATHPNDLPDLVKLGGPLLVVTELDSICGKWSSKSGRVAACLTTAEEFPGRCEAYRLGGTDLQNRFSGCVLARESYLPDLRPYNIPMRGFYGWTSTSDHLREAIRVYASAMDAEVRTRACEVAALMPETQDLPECAR